MQRDARLEAVSISSPCPKSWADMPGSEARRFCDACSLHVHNLSAMTKGEAETFLQEQPPGRVCVTYLPDSKGGVVTRAEPPAGTNWWTRAAGLLACLFLLLPGCKRAEADPKQEDDPKACPDPLDSPSKQDLEDLRALGGMVMGEIAMPEPIVIEGAVTGE